MFNKKICALFLFFLACSLLPHRSFANYSFPRNLTIGDSGQDVLQLQKILNENQNTQIATTGFGSPGNETTYFGARTKNAVIKYQNMHAGSILIPSGISYGNGFVGQMTRSVLMSSNDSARISVSTPPPSTVAPVQTQPTSNSLLAEKQPLALFKVSQFEVAPGTDIVLTGMGFSAINTVYIDGSVVFDNVSSLDGTTIKISIPSILSVGRHDLAVKNKNGTTRQKVSISVTHTPVSGPKVLSISSSLVNEDELIVVGGSGFTNDNSIYTGFGSIEHIQSDSTKITFKLSSLSESSKLKNVREKLGYPIPVAFYIINEHGYTDTYSLVTLK